MTNLNSNLHVVARVFLGLLSLVAGLGKLGNVMQMTMFFKKIGLAGGYLLLANAGSGAFSVDARKG
ncbi:MAG: hypothetical protein EBX04_00630 [Rhodobacteraceae bacterium]|nr:hypothetical protein [Paracoccaceae bacterium]